MGKLIKISKLAEELGVTRQCLYSWQKKGKVKFVKSLGGSYYVTEELFNTLVNKNILKEDEKVGQ